MEIYAESSQVSLREKRKAEKGSVYDTAASVRSVRIRDFLREQTIALE
jgi:hypothetical protein